MNKCPGLLLVVVLTLLAAVACGGGGAAKVEVGSSLVRSIFGESRAIELNAEVLTDEAHVSESVLRSTAETLPTTQVATEVRGDLATAGSNERSIIIETACQTVTSGDYSDDAIATRLAVNGFNAASSDAYAAHQAVKSAATALGAGASSPEERERSAYELVCGVAGKLSE